MVSHNHIVSRKKKEKKIPAKFFDEGGGVASDVAREVDGVNALEDDVVRLHGIQSGEGRRSRQQFEHENAQRPVVGANVVPFVQNHFRGNVFGSAAKRPRLTSGLSIETQIKSVKKKKQNRNAQKNSNFHYLQLFGETEIDEFDVAVGVEE